MAARLRLEVITGTAFHLLADRCVASANNTRNEGALRCAFVLQHARKFAQSSSLFLRVRRASRSCQQSPSSSWRVGKKRLVSVRMSVDVDDSASAEGSAAAKITEEQLMKEATGDLQKELDSRRGLEERYLVVNIGKYECRSCGYVYESEKGDSNYPIPGGVAFLDLPSDWRCPTCGAAQSFFVSKGVEVAGFAQNQSYGLGGNSMTEGQKSLLIYGSLVFFIALFLGGYLLQ